MPAVRRKLIDITDVAFDYAVRITLPVLNRSTVVRQAQLSGEHRERLRIELVLIENLSGHSERHVPVVASGDADVEQAAESRERVSRVSPRTASRSRFD